MKLFIFEAIGSYFGGALGVIADTAEEAAEIANKERDDKKQAFSEWEQRRPYDRQTWDTCDKEVIRKWSETMPYPEWFADTCVVDSNKDNPARSAPNRFVLSNEYNLSDGYEKGVQFTHFYEE